MGVNVDVGCGRVWVWLGARGCVTHTQPGLGRTRLRPQQKKSSWQAAGGRPEHAGTSSPALSAAVIMHRDLCDHPDPESLAPARPLLSHSLSLTLQLPTWHMVILLHVHPHPHPHTHPHGRRLPLKSPVAARSASSCLLGSTSSDPRSRPFAAEPHLRPSRLCLSTPPGTVHPNNATQTSRTLSAALLISLYARILCPTARYICNPRQ